jgi:gamma-glutamyltranspeptidase/glutathione hydrolase
MRRAEARFKLAEDGKGAEATGGMVASAFPLATEAGREILEVGGNAVDAACAVGFALGVCEPQASGLGGQTLALMHLDGRTTAIDGSSRVPSLAHRMRVHEGDAEVGYRAATVPSTVATFGWMHRNYGRVDWRTVLEPAIRIARHGYAITQLQRDLQKRERKTFLSIPSLSGARYFLRDGRKAHRVGDVFRQPELAATLEEIARGGPEAFYSGDIAAQIDADMRANDGFLRADDLALIPWPVERRPLRRRYRSTRIASMPPPGAGRTLLLVMMMLERLKSRFLAGDDPHRYHFIAETFRKAFLLRQDRPFDPTTYPQIKDKKMLSRAFASELAMSIADEMDVSLPMEDVVGEQIGNSRGETTHFSVMDNIGNAVAVTQSIELVYGSKAAAAGLGFLYNNYMMALEVDNPAHPYYLRPNAIPWSSATPTIVFRNDQPWLVVGSPGSERIFSSVSQFLVSVIDRSNGIDAAMLEPRFHCSIGGRISIEAERFDPRVIEHLASLGYTIDEREAYAFYLGCIQAVLKRQTGPGFQGIADIRRDGTAAGPG